MDSVKKAFDKVRLITLASSLGYAILPAMLYYSWVKRNGFMFGFCLFLICMMSVMNISFLIKANKIRKDKERVLSWINNAKENLIDFGGKVNPILARKDLKPF